MAHTPSPWTLYVNEAGGFEVATAEVLTPGRYVICARADFDHRADESVANAHLIAAAPELLNALNAVVEDAAFFGWHAKGLMSDETRVKIRAAFDKVRAEAK